MATSDRSRNGRTAGGVSRVHQCQLQPPRLLWFFHYSELSTLDFLRILEALQVSFQFITFLRKLTGISFYCLQKSILPGIPNMLSHIHAFTILPFMRVLIFICLLLIFQALPPLLPNRCRYFHRKEGMSLQQQSSYCTPIICQHVFSSSGKLGLMKKMPLNSWTLFMFCCKCLDIFLYNMNHNYQQSKLILQGQATPKFQRITFRKFASVSLRS